MTNRFTVFIALLKKDVRGALPIILLTGALFSLDAIIASFDNVEANSILVTLQIYVPYLVYFTCGMMIFAIFQLDPANSLSHDWLIRPMPKKVLVAAKVTLVLLVLFVPLFVARFVVNLITGYTVLESFLEASHIRNSWTLLVLPALIAVAILSKSFMQSIGLLIGLSMLLLVVASIPPLFPPSPDAIGGEVTLNAIDWMLGYLISMLCIASLVVVYWVQYYLRQFNLAKSILAGSLSVVTLLILGIMAVPSWNLVFAIQKSTFSEPEISIQNSLKLDPVSACFPATLLEELARPGEVGNPNNIVGREHWPSYRIAQAGVGGVSFATTVTTRAIPEDWRVFTLKATATYTADSLAEELRLTPSGSFYGNPVVPYNNSSTHYWLLPGNAANKLTLDSSTQLHLDYSLAVLTPTVFEIEMNAERRYYPGMGYCSASHDRIQNQVDVQCFKRGAQPALISAELKNIPASRVDSGRPNLTPKWLQLFDGQHYEITVPSPSMSSDSTLLVTAYETSELFNKRFSSPGIIGAPPSTCPLTREHLVQQSNWSDNSPHDTSFIEVEDEVFLEVLDWGGEGMPIILLAGGGATAHSFDQFAPQLTENHRVIGITRRGFGASSKPDFGYGIARLSEDIVAVLNNLEIDSAIFAGHSLAGHELSVLGRSYSEYTEALIFLDAAYDNSSMAEGSEETQYWANLPPSPFPTPDELVSYDAMQRYIQRVGGVSIPEGEVMAIFDFSSGTRNFDPLVVDAVMAGLEPPYYEQISIPTLAIYAIEQDSLEDYMRPWYDSTDPIVMESVEKLYNIRTNFQQNQIVFFQNNVPDSEVLILEDSDHWVFLAHEQRVLDAVEDFLEKLN